MKDFRSKMKQMRGETLPRSGVGVVVITSALHAEGRGFEPRTPYFNSIIYIS